MYLVDHCLTNSTDFYEMVVLLSVMFFAAAMPYNFSWHSDSHIMALDNKFVLVFGKKQMRKMPLGNSLVWNHGEDRKWLEYKGESIEEIAARGCGLKQLLKKVTY